MNLKQIQQKLQDLDIEFKTKRLKKKGRYSISINIEDISQWDYDETEEMYNNTKDGETMGLNKADKNWIVEAMTEVVKPIIQRLDRVEKRLDRVEKRLDRVEKNIDKNYKLIKQYHPEA